MTKRLAIGLLLFVLWSAPSANAATMFKCQAADGRITYTDQPCSAGVVTQQRIEPDTAPAAPGSFTVTVASGSPLRISLTVTSAINVESAMRR